MKFFILIGLYFISSSLILAQNISEKTFNNINAIKVTGKFMSVVVIGENRENVDVRTEMSDRAAEYFEINFSESGQNLEIEVVDKKKRFNWGDIKGEIFIKIPKSVILNIRNSSGKVDVKNIDSESVNLLASSGSVYANNLIAQTINLKTSSGSIHINELKGQVIDMESSSGSQSLKNIEANLKSVSSSGSISIIKFKGEIELRSSSGRLSGENVTLISSGKFKSSSGSIKIALENNPNDLSFNCSSSSGGIRIGNEKGSKKFILNEGDIRIEAISSSGSQNFSFVQ